MITPVATKSPTLFPAICLLVSGLYVSAQPQPGSVLWTYEASVPGWIYTSPALGPDGTVYLGAGSLCAVTNSGAVASNKWTFAASPASAPVVGPEGTIYFGGQDGNLYAVNPDGSQKWAYPAQGGEGAPAIARDGTIYFEGYSFLYALTNAGDSAGLKWKVVVGDAGHYSSPAIGPDGTIYIGSWGAYKLYAFAPDGSQRWVRDLLPNMNPGSAPCIGADGTVYVTAGSLTAFSSDGTNLWYDSPGGLLLDGPPVIGKNGMIYVGQYQSHTLFAFTPDGQLAWWALNGGPRLRGIAAAVDGAGMIYYSVSNSLWALNPEGQVQWAVTQPGIPPPGGAFAVAAPIIGPDGTIYAPLGPTLYAIAGTNPPSSSGWPMYQQNARHTGKVEKSALVEPKRRADANFEFQLHAQLGQTNVIETTTNLSNWTSLTSVVVTTVPQPVVDLTASNHPARFYRSTAP